MNVLVKSSGFLFWFYGLRLYNFCYADFKLTGLALPGEKQILF